MARALLALCAAEAFLPATRLQARRASAPRLEAMTRGAMRPAPEVLALQRAVVAVRALPRVANDTSIRGSSSNRLDATCRADKPTFRRLFTHDTWELHLGGTALQRWWRCTRATWNSVILRSVLPSVAAIACYAALVLCVLPARVVATASNQQLPLSFCGSAIGLLLVFRTNNAYNRLGEARRLWGLVVHRCRSVASRVATSSRSDRGAEAGAACDCCRYLCAFCWALRDQLRDGDERDDILKLLLDDPAEAQWVATSPDRPHALLGRLRDRVHAEWRTGGLTDNEHLVLEGDLEGLGRVAADCQRIFSSPIPPTMSRHGIRSLSLWILGIPVVLAGTVPNAVNVLWTAVTAFVYLGIDELGVQVEQPFAIMPLWQLCQQANDAVLAGVDAPERALYLPRALYR